MTMFMCCFDNLLSFTVPDMVADLKFEAWMPGVGKTDPD